MKTFRRIENVPKDWEELTLEGDADEVWSEVQRRMSPETSVFSVLVLEDGRVNATRIDDVEAFNAGEQLHSALPDIYPERRFYLMRKER